jgi:hypothetical protein
MKRHQQLAQFVLAPFVFAIVLLVVMIPLAILAAILIPYFSIDPDRHLHIYDLDGTSRQRELLAKWRAVYRGLGFRGRLRRALIVGSRRQKLGAARRISAITRNAKRRHAAAAAPLGVNASGARP